MGSSSTSRAYGKAEMLEGRSLMPGPRFAAVLRTAVTLHQRVVTFVDIEAGSVPREASRPATRQAWSASAWISPKVFAKRCLHTTGLQVGQTRLIADSEGRLLEGGYLTSSAWRIARWAGSGSKPRTQTTASRRQ